MYYIVFLLGLCSVVFGAPRADCSISVNQDLGEPQPLILNPSITYGSEAFYLPSNDDVISLNVGQKVQLACPGGTLILNGASTTQDVGEATCTTGNKFTINKLSLSFQSIVCTRYPFHTARYSGRSCLTDYREIEIGFIVGSRFVKTMNVCFDDVEQTSLYSTFNLTSTIAGYQTGFPRPDWIQDGFYSLGSDLLNTLYTTNKQRTTINALLGLPSNSYKYIAQSGDYFLARGHLTAKGDFIFGNQHRTTFHYANAAPQWQVFNGGNWNFLENDCRNFASSRGLDLVVYTGTHGVTTLPHETTGEDVELYLYVNGEKQGIPVPRLYWKVLYEPKTKAGVAFVGVNNPYVIDATKDVICESICDEIDWLTWYPDQIERGISYCCTVEDFRKRIDFLPNFSVVQLLK